MTDLLRREPHVISAGLGLLADAAEWQAARVTRVDWTPPMAGVEEDLVTVLADPRRAAANALAVERMFAARAQLVDVLPARDALGLRPGQFLHAGPPIGWDRASGPLRGALMGAAVFEGLAAGPEAAAGMAERGEFALVPCHARRAVGPMAGVVSPSMWVFVLEDPATGQRAHCSLNEGLGKVLRYGAYSPDVIDRLRWMSSLLGPLLQAVVRGHGPVDVSAILAQMVQMGDEAHNRNRTGTLMLLRDLLPSMIASGFPPADVAAVAAFIGGNDHFFLNLAMPACKLALDAARDIPGSTMVVAMARLRHPGLGDGGRVVHRPGAHARGPVPGRLRAEGRQPRHRGLGDHGDGGPGRLRHGGGPGHRAVRRRHSRRRARHHPAHVRDHAGRAPAVPGAGARLPRHPGRHRHHPGRADRHPAADQHRQVGAGLVTPPAGIFPAALRALARVVSATGA